MEVVGVEMPRYVPIENFETSVVVVKASRRPIARKMWGLEIVAKISRTALKGFSARKIIILLITAAFVSDSDMMRDAKIVIKSWHDYAYDDAVVA